MYENICHQIYADEFCSDALPGTPAAAIVAVPEFSAFIYKSGLQDVLFYLFIQSYIEALVRDSTSGRG